MKNIILTFSIGVLLLQTLNAQQEHHYTQFMYNKLLLNPAYAGARGVPTATVLYRNQWAGFEGAPQSALLSFNSPFLSKRVGIGANMSLQSIGLQRDFQASLAYSYDLIAADELSLRAGVSVSMRSLSIDFTDAQPSAIGDPSLGNARVNDLYYNVGAGLYATYADQFYAGFSVPRIYSNVLGVNDNTNAETAKEYRHFYATAGGVLKLNDDFNLLPAILLKYVENAPFDADVNMNLEIKNKVVTGLSYRVGGEGAGESVSLLAFWQATDQVGVGAAYDFTLTQIRDYSSGSFEVLLRADLKKRQAGGRSRKMSNPRFFIN